MALFVFADNRLSLFTIEYRLHLKNNERLCGYIQKNH